MLSHQTLQGGICSIDENEFANGVDPSPHACRHDVGSIREQRNFNIECMHELRCESNKMPNEE